VAVGEQPPIFWLLENLSENFCQKMCKFGSE